MSEQLFRDMILNCKLLKKKIKTCCQRYNKPNIENYFYQYIFQYFVNYQNYSILLEKMLNDKKYFNEIFKNSYLYYKATKVHK